MKLSVVLLVLLNLSAIYCEDKQSSLDILSVNDDYMNVFQTTPTLFQYLFNLLQEKPEILERNDIRTFTEDNVGDDEVYLSKEDNLKRELEESNFIGARNRIFYLTPNEVMEQILLVERKLEDYNSEKRN